MGRQLFIVFALHRQTGRQWKGDAQKDGEPCLAGQRGCSPSRCQVDGEKCKILGHGCVSSPWELLDASYPGSACTSGCTRLGGTGADPGSWLSCIPQRWQAQAIGEDGTCRWGLPAAWDATVLGMKREGWGSTAWGGQGRSETCLREAPQPFLAHLEGHEARVGLQAGLGMVLAAGRVCPSLPELPCTFFCCWR